MSTTTANMAPRMGFNTRLVLQLIPALMVGLTVSLFYVIDTKFMPVVEDFKVESASRVGELLVIQGTMKQVRTCEFKGLKVFGRIEGLGMEDLPFVLERGSQRKGVGFQSWGPWQVVVPMRDDLRYIDIEATHQCAGPWTQKAIYTQFDVRSIK